MTFVQQQQQQGLKIEFEFFGNFECKPRTIMYDFLLMKSSLFTLLFDWATHVQMNRIRYDVIKKFDFSQNH